MHGALLAPVAEFLELDLALDALAILGAVIIRALALLAVEFYEMVL